MTDLLPCPFCGGAPKINQIGNEYTTSRGFEVKCAAWGCATKKRALVKVHTLEDARRFAITAWNTRAPSSPEIGERVDLAERLREMVRTDHLRGCKGREYECSCGHTDRQDALLLEAADALATPSDKGEGQ